MSTSITYPGSPNDWEGRIVTATCTTEDNGAEAEAERQEEHNCFSINIDIHQRFYRKDLIELKDFIDNLIVQLENYPDEENEEDE